MSIFKALFSNEGIRFLVRALKARFRDQAAEFEIIGRHLRPGDIACDIGANKGSFTYWLSEWCRGGRVIAFEPQPELARRLAETCRSIGLDNVTVEAKAVYSHSGDQELFVPEGHQPGASLSRNAFGAGSVSDVFSWLEALGYQGSFVRGNELVPIAEFDAAVHQRQDGEWFWKSKNYCNNFVFRKPGGTSAAAR